MGRLNYFAFTFCCKIFYIVCVKLTYQVHFLHVFPNVPRQLKTDFFLIGPRKWWRDIWRHKWHQVLILNSITYCTFITKSLLTKIIHLAQKCDSIAVPASYYCVHSFYLEKVSFFTGSFLLRTAMPWAGKNYCSKAM